jgi:hypothetical protein
MNDIDTNIDGDENTNAGITETLLEDLAGGVSCPTTENLERAEKKAREEAERPLDLKKLMEEALAAHRMVDGKTLWAEMQPNAFEDGWYDPSTFAAGPFENTLDGFEYAYGWWKRAAYSAHVVDYMKNITEDVVVGYEGMSDNEELIPGRWEAEETGWEEEQKEIEQVEENMDYLLRHDLVEELKKSREVRTKKMVEWLSGDLKPQTLRKAWATFWRKLIRSRQKCSQTGMWWYVWLTKSQAKQVEDLLRKKLGR